MNIRLMYQTTNEANYTNEDKMYRMNIRLIDYMLIDKSSIGSKKYVIERICSYPKFNPHFRLFLAVTVLSSFFLWALCPTNFILFVW